MVEGGQVSEMTPQDREVASWPLSRALAGGAAAFPRARLVGPRMVEMRPWWQNPMFQELGQGLQAAGDGLRQLQAMRPEDVLTEGAIDPEEALRQLRMERARQHYERSFGMANRGGQSLAAQGRQQDVDALLERIKLARQMHNWQPGT